MKKNTWPLESDATVAVDAAARANFEATVAEARDASPERRFPEWDDLNPVQKLALREAVLPTVWAALAALPDPRKQAWLEGLYCGLRQGYEDDNPYAEPED